VDGMPVDGSPTVAPAIALLYGGSGFKLALRRPTVDLTTYLYWRQRDMLEASVTPWDKTLPVLRAAAEILQGRNRHRLIEIEDPSVGAFVIELTPLRCVGVQDRSSAYRRFVEVVEGLDPLRTVPPTLGGESDAECAAALAWTHYDTTATGAPDATRTVSVQVTAVQAGTPASLRFDS